MNRIVVLFMLLVFIFSSCDEEVNYDSNKLLEIELISPAEIQGEMINIPINTPIRFQAKCNDEGAGEIYWYNEKEGVYHSLDDEISFDKNGLYCIYFGLRNSKYSAERTFFWINVVGKVVTDVEEDEVGCAMVESGTSIYIVTKKRKSFTKSGVFLYKYTEGELEKSDYLENVNQIFDAKKIDDGRIIFLTNDGFVLVNPSDNSVGRVEGTEYTRAHIINCANEELLIAGVEGHKGILEKRKLSGELVEKKTIYKDEYDDQIKDVGFLNENDFVILCQQNDYHESFISEKRFSLNSNDDNSAWSRDFEFFMNDGYSTTNVGINSIKSGVMLYGFYDDNTLYQWNYNDKYQVYFKRGFDFKGQEVFSADDYFCETLDENSVCRDRRIWGWQNKDYAVTLFQNQILVEDDWSRFNEKTKIFEIDHSFKVDWVFESDDSYLLLINTQKYGKYDYDYQGNSKRYCSIFRMDKRGDFIDLY